MPGTIADRFGSLSMHSQKGERPEVSGNGAGHKGPKRVFTIR